MVNCSVWMAYGAPPLILGCFLGAIGGIWLSVWVTFDTSEPSPKWWKRVLGGISILVISLYIQGIAYVGAWDYWTSCIR